MNRANYLRVLALSRLSHDRIHQKRTHDDFDKLSMFFMLNVPNCRISPWFSSEDSLSHGGQNGIDCPVQLPFIFLLEPRPLQPIHGSTGNIGFDSHTVAPSQVGSKG